MFRVTVKNRPTPSTTLMSSIVMLAESSLVMVPRPLASVNTAEPVLPAFRLKSTVKVSSGSTTVSPLTTTVMVCVKAAVPARKVSVPALVV